MVGRGSDGVRAKALVIRALRKQKGRKKERKTKIPLKKSAEMCVIGTDMIGY